MNASKVSVILFNIIVFSILVDCRIIRKRRDTTDDGEADGEVVGVGNDAMNVALNSALNLYTNRGPSVTAEEMDDMIGNHNTNGGDLAENLMETLNNGGYSFTITDDRGIVNDIEEKLENAAIDLDQETRLREQETVSNNQVMAVGSDMFHVLNPLSNAPNFLSNEPNSLSETTQAEIQQWKISLSAPGGARKRRSISDDEMEEFLEEEETSKPNQKRRSTSEDELAEVMSEELESESE